MNLIDERGRLLGLVNVIDAIAVAVVLAAVVAGIAFVDPFSEPPPTEPTTRYATVDLGTQPTFIAEQIEVGDVMAADAAPGNLTVTDVYVSTSQSGNASVVVRVEVEGVLASGGGRVGRTLTYAGNAVRPGEALRITTEQYSVAGTVTALERSGTTLPTEATPATLEATVAARTAESITPGDEIVSAGRTVATITSVASRPTNDPGVRHLYIGAELMTLRNAEQRRFAHGPLRPGTTLPLETDDYAVTGTVVSVGSTGSPGEPLTRTITVWVENVEPSFAAGLRPGLSEVVRGTTYAEVTDVAVEPYVLVVRDEGGNVSAREHPLRKTVRLTVRVRATNTLGGLRFHAEPLRLGQRVTFDFRTVTVSGNVLRIGE